MIRTSLVLVEDHKDTLDALSIFLAGKYAVFGYTSPTEALQAIDVVKPDILVLDIGLHPLDGLQCLVAIRDMPGYRDIPAVALTGFAREVDRRRFLDGGFQAVVAKPVPDLDDFVSLIDTLANSRGTGPRPIPVSPRPAGFVDPGPAILASGKDGSSPDGDGP